MKKLIIKATMMVAVFFGISNYFLYIMTGKSPFSDFKLPSLSMEKPSLSSVNPLGGKETFYKWVDENGITQYSSEPPPEHVQAKTLELDPNLNIVKGIEMPEDEPKKEAPTTPNVALPQGPIYSPESIKKLMDDAKNVQNLMDERVETQQKILEEL